MKWVLIGLAVIGGVAVLVLLVGLLRPARHVASVRISLRATPETVWRTLTDIERWGEWAADIERTERRPNAEGREVWITVGKWGEMLLEVTASDPPHRLQTYVDGGSFSGRWTYELEPQGDGTRLTITEEGEVGNPLMRGMMMFHDDYASMKGFLRGLGTSLGETVEPVELR